MTKTELWDILVAKNPCFLTGPIPFKPVGLRKFFDLVWDEAQEEAREEIRGGNRFGMSYNPYDALFGKMR